MQCETYTFSNTSEFLTAVNKRVCSERIPLCGSIDLTDRCNLDCVHCYVKQNSPAENESTTEQILSYIDQSVEQGCLFMLLTGGEPLLRKDFCEIYEHTKRKGLLVTIFTNGTLVDEDMASFLADLPPFTVEISIYGATDETHDRITGVKGSFKKALKGFNLLKRHNLEVTLKTILMTLNKDEIEGMIALAEQNHAKFRMDGAIFPRLNGDTSPMQYRLTPREVVEREFLLPERTSDWRKFMDNVGKLEPSEALYDCGAGVSCFHISAEGLLKPCIMTQAPFFSLKTGSFRDGWKKMTEILDKKPEPDYPCSSCENRLICDSCPGFFKLETGNEKLYSNYVCKIAHERAQKL